LIGRRTFVRASALALAGVVPRAAADALPRIGVLAPGSNPREPAFWQGMRDLGYIEGKTVVVDRRSAEGDFTRLPALAQELVKNRPDVLVAIVSAAAIALKQATSSIPIVVVGASDPVAAGLAGNLARPGGNVTGTSSQSSLVVGKLLELLRQILPKASRVAALWDPVNLVSQQLRLGETLIAAARLHLLVRIIEVVKREDLDRVFSALRSDRPDGVLVSGDTYFLSNAAHVAELGLANGLPVFSSPRQLTEAGILASYGPDITALGIRTAAYVHRILKGAKPANLPIELPTKFETVINLRTASALGIVIPDSVIARADGVIR
jgi:putative ABC transport system substrate-binding protein